MQDELFWVTRFEEQRPRLRALAYRMLGSFAEADDALQETWLRVARAAGGDAPDVDNPAGWLTTVVARQCLNMLRARAHRGEVPLEARVPDPVVERADTPDPADEAALADSVGLALLVVLEALEPAERLAFVLHDMFDIPFGEIAPIVGRSTDAARQLASRARRRVRGAAPSGRPDRARQRQIAEAWVAAARQGDLEGLIALLHPDAVLRVDTGGRSSRVVHGAAEVARRAGSVRNARVEGVIARVNGGAGIVGWVGDRPVAVLAFTVVDGLIAEIDILTDHGRLAALDLPRP